MTAGAISVFLHLVITILGDEIALPRRRGGAAGNWEAQEYSGKRRGEMP